jgi:hypothetical protein
MSGANAIESRRIANGSMISQFGSAVGAINATIIVEDLRPQIDTDGTQI